MPESASRRAQEFRVAEAGGEVVVDEAGSLHESVADGGTDETKAALQKLFAELAREIGFGGDLLHAGYVILNGRTTDKIPDELVEGAEFPLHPQEGLGVRDGGLDFKAIADDARVAKEGAEFFGFVAGDFGGIEAAEELAIAFTFLKDGVPAEAGLRAFEDQEFEPTAVVVDGNAPFFVVVLDAEGIGGPGAAQDVFADAHELEPHARTEPAFRIIFHASLASKETVSSCAVRTWGPAFWPPATLRMQQKGASTGEAP